MVYNPIIAIIFLFCSAWAIYTIREEDKLNGIKEVSEIEGENDISLNLTNRNIAATRNSVLDSAITNEFIDDENDESTKKNHLEIEEEGSYEKFVEHDAGKRLVKTKVRSKNNRDLALHIHGHNCIVCDFNFDQFYGSEISRGFIHIHHTRPIAKNTIQKPDVATDLVPVCPNCHAMIHRKKEEISIRELRTAVKANKRINSTACSGESS